MNILICDDDLNFSNELQSMLEVYLNERHHQHFQFFLFSSGEELIQYCQQTPDFYADFLFLDIDMPHLNGFDTLKSLKSINHPCITFIISSYHEFVFDCFEYHIFQFIPKPLVPEKLKNHFFRALDQYSMLNKKILIYQDKRHIVIGLDDIICIESYRQKITLYTTAGTYTTNKKISEMEALLSYRNFLRSHKSFIINMDKVLYYEENRFFLHHNVAADISFRKRSEIIRTFNHYILTKHTEIEL